MDKEVLNNICKEIRKDVVRSIPEAGSGHTGGSLGLADVFTVLYFNILNHKPSDPKWPDRDRFHLSKGHCCPAVYAALAECVLRYNWLDLFKEG